VEIRNALRERTDHGSVFLDLRRKKELNESDFRRAADMAFPSESKKRARLFERANANGKVVVTNCYDFCHTIGSCYGDSSFPLLMQAIYRSPW
jgi:hypothetical protein